MENCTAVFPKTGDPCTKHVNHNSSTDAIERQHVTGTGTKWPHLHLLDPDEGYNGPMPFRI